jgi:hypothetical protein
MLFLGVPTFKNKQKKTGIRTTLKNILQVGVNFNKSFPGLVFLGFYSF